MSWSVVASCIPHIRDPDPPETEALESAYEEPPGRLTGNGIRTIAETVGARLRELESIGELQELQTLIDDVRNEDNGVVPDGSLNEEDSESERVLIVARIVRKCRGHDAEMSVPDAADGTIELTVKAGEHGLFPIVWGRITQCRTQVGSVGTTIDGEVFARARNTARGQVMLYSFDGSVQVGGVSTPLSINFRRYEDGIKELLFPATDGNMVVEVNPDQTKVARDSVGRWMCDLEEASCTSMQTGETITASDEVPQ